MAHFATTRMSSKGQIVIPEDIRNELNLREGTEFVVLGEQDTVILKSITQPGIDDFKTLLTKAEKQAKQAKLKKSDLKRIIKKVRK